ncbi:MAG TPA: LON peptidase substrate-binding domain-containing protein [Pirellulaceae bacterium]|jgi:ATP-dependent Lon protease|nr:LON peptidase substrate-binding domain-containing protein [Pirellulaceae bacterium]
MPDFEDIFAVPAQFSGYARLFPVPNLVMFPAVLQPLNVFELRYREMVKEALETDMLIAMANLQEGWENDYEGRPPVHSVACLGKIVMHTRLPDGRYNLLLQGLRRIKIVRETPPIRPFRIAEVEILDDEFEAAADSSRAEMHRELLDLFGVWASRSDFSPEQFRQIFSMSMPLGALADIVGYTIPFSDATRRRLLSETCVDRRASMLLKRLRKRLEASESLEDEEAFLEPATASALFPPPFSVN